MHDLTFTSGLIMFAQYLLSTRPPIFSTQRGLDDCSPGPQVVEHLPQSMKFQRNVGVRGVRSFIPNQYFIVTFSFGKTCRIKDPSLMHPLEWLGRYGEMEGSLSLFAKRGPNARVSSRGH